jgi:hypothetical protein
MKNAVKLGIVSVLCMLLLAGITFAAVETFWYSPSNATAAKFGSGNTVINTTWEGRGGSAISNASLEINYTTAAVNYTMFLYNGTVNFGTWSWNASTLITGAGNWEWRVFSTAVDGTQNVTSSYQLTLNTADNPLKITINNGTAQVAKNVSITYGTSVIVNSTNSTGSAEQFLDGALIVNPYTSTFGVGTYMFVANTTTNQNYTVNTTSIYLTVNKATPSTLVIAFNKTSYPASAVHWVKNSTMVNITTVSDHFQSPVLLWVNNTLWNTSTSATMTNLSNNWKAANGGKWNISVVQASSTNYSALMTTNWIGIDNAAPVLTHTSGEVMYIGQSSPVYLNATVVDANSGVITSALYEINGINYTMVDTGSDIYRATVTGLDYGNYSVRVFANDNSAGGTNWGSTTGWVNFVEVIAGGGGSPSGGGGYYVPSYEPVEVQPFATTGAETTGLSPLIVVLSLAVAFALASK